MKLLLVLPLLLCACASQTVYHVGTDDSGRPVVAKTFQNYGDIIGNATIRVGSDGAVYMSAQQPPAADIPVARTVVLNKARDQVIGYNEVPMLAGIYNSKATEANYHGMGFFARNLSNLAGTILSGIMGIVGLSSSASAASAAANP